MDTRMKMGTDVVIRPVKEKKERKMKVTDLFSDIKVDHKKKKAKGKKKK